MSRKHFLTLFLWTVSVGQAATPPGTPPAIPYDPISTPAVTVPASRWGALEPVHTASNPQAGILGDNTAFNDQFPPRDEPFYHDVSIVAHGGTVSLFAATGLGIEIWDVTRPEQPVRKAYRLAADELPITGPSDFDFPIRWLHTNRHDRLAVAAVDYGGFTIWDTTDKVHPFVLFQDQNVDGDAVWMFRAGDRDFVWVGQTDGDGGAHLYDADGFKVLQVGAERNVQWLHGYQQGDETYLAMNWLEGATRVEIFDTSNAPQAPISRLIGTFPEQVRQVALFPRDDRWYLAGLGHASLLVYDVTCIRSGCGGLPQAERILETGTDPGVFNHELSLVETAAGTYLYTGINAEGFDCQNRKQYLFDIRTWSDIVHRDDYFLWYHHACASGFNHVMSRRAVGHPRAAVIYRAGFSLLDSHRLTQPDVAFADSFESGDTSAWTVTVP